MNQSFDQKFLSAALGVSWKNPSPSSNVYQRIWTDSRTCQANDLFVAIKGDHFDGHQFVEMAMKSGAKGALVSSPVSLSTPADFQVVYVEDTLEALRKLASLYRTTVPCEIIAVGGSNGKTTTKEMISFLLGELHGKENVFKTKKSENSILGIALSVLQIRSEKWAVLEIGIDEPGWMEKHLSLVRPHFGVITTIGEEHLERLKSIERVAEEELKLLKYLIHSEGGFAANLDSSWIAQEPFPKQTVTYSLKSEAALEGSFLAPQTLHCYGLEWTLRLPGSHNAQNLLAALAVLKVTHPNLDLARLKGLSQSLERFHGEAHRSEWFRLKNGMYVYDDCYNANPDSMEKALDTFIELSRGKTSLVILGDMLDLGEASETAHRRILNRAAVGGFDQVLLFGPRFAKAYESAAMKDAHVKSLTHLKELSSVLGHRPEAVLLKGSRGMKLERILPILEALPP